jgi:hypothetical protein
MEDDANSQIRPDNLWCIGLVYSKYCNRLHSQCTLNDCTIQSGLIQNAHCTNSW